CSFQSFAAFPLVRISVIVDYKRHMEMLQHKVSFFGHSHSKRIQSMIDAFAAGIETFHVDT
ncbi:hypothetical protein, partial [Geobacillus thermodenitrificans]|uniref:hypothetical protein n=1 Tax=Geobacillus thermodenitrificans TaxID=33940 RepID=UPI003D246436